MYTYKMQQKAYAYFAEILRDVLMQLNIVHTDFNASYSKKEKSTVKYGQYNFKEVFFSFFSSASHPKGCKESSILKYAV